MCKVISIVNQKGGVAKTTTTVNLGIGLVREGKKVLLIDVDSQGSLSSSLGVSEPDELDITLSSIMGKVMNDEDYGKQEGVLAYEEGVSFLPCNIELSGLEVTLVNAMRREYILKEYITSVRNQYDYILIDCNSSLGMVTMNALTAADSIIIPIEAAYLSLKGLQQLITTIGKTKKYLNPNLGIEGIVFTKMVGRTNNAKEIKAMVEENYGRSVRVFEAVIPHSVRAAETAAEGVSIFKHDPRGKVAAAYSMVMHLIFNAINVAVSYAGMIMIPGWFLIGAFIVGVIGFIVLWVFFFKKNPVELHVSGYKDRQLVTKEGYMTMAVCLCVTGMLLMI